MRQELWPAVESAFAGALGIPEPERREWVARSCRDPEVRAEVEALLGVYTRAEGFLGPAHGLLAGARLGPYEVVGLIGAGGMGEVYRAHDPRIVREVAIKVLPAPFAADSDRLRRFTLEVRAAGSLNHPNVMAIYDVGDFHGTPYVICELLEGETLRKRLERGPVPLTRAMEYASGVAAGLAAAHGKHIVHRDLKPENVFLTTNGSVKILDFGLARLSHSEAAHLSKTTETAPGVILGTAAYMAPEQVRGQPCDHRSDIFSFGVILYEMLTGKKAFPGDSAVEIMAAVLNTEPPDVSDAPQPLARILRRCMEKNAAQRFQSVTDLAFSLESLRENRTTAAAGTAHTVDSIAVLPFTNSGNDADAEYLCDGITESILNSLSQIAQLRVVPRSTVFRYKGRDVDPQALGRELNVRVVLTGRLIQRGDSLIISAELLDVEARSQLWGERYNSKLSDIFALEQEIAHKIVDRLRTKLTGQERDRLAKRFTEDTEAYQFYLRGRHHWTKRTPEHLKKGVEYFQKAIEKDPGYALAYAGLADCYSILATYDILPPKETYGRAKAAAAAAVAFDDELAEAHTSLAYIRSYFDWEWSAGEREFHRALDLNPSYWIASHWYGSMLSSSGRLEDAERRIRRAMELEPTSPLVMHVAAMNSLFGRKYDEMIERSLRGLANDPDYFLLKMWLSVGHQFQGRYRDALQEIEKAVDLCNASVSWVVGALGNAHAVAGNRQEAARILDELIARAERDSIGFTGVLLIYAGLGETESALNWLEKACDERGVLTTFVKGDPRFDGLRAEPRFQAVLRRMNLAR